MSDAYVHVDFPRRTCIHCSTTHVCAWYSNFVIGATPPGLKLRSMPITRASDPNRRQGHVFNKGCSSFVDSETSSLLEEPGGLLSLCFQNNCSATQRKSFTLAALFSRYGANVRDIREGRGEKKKRTERNRAARVGSDRLFVTADHLSQ